MKISLDWLKEYVELPDNQNELVDVLPMLGLEVEEDELFQFELGQGCGGKSNQ